MESDNLRTASVYINNQLLSRGLLRNGQVIDFARPDLAEAGLEATMGKIMSVVNDLILRRDRDCVQRESLSQTLRTIRADTMRQTTDLERLQMKHVDAQRRLGLAEGTERAMKAQIRSAEQAAKLLKEEMARMRVLVAQTRASCANDVRKRERVIEGMKKHVGEGGRARGSGKAAGVATITVVAGVGSHEASKAMAVEDSNYDLRTETNEFLTELARGLSDENEKFGALLRRIVKTLRSLSGLEQNGVQEEDLVEHINAGHETLSEEVDSIIEHLRTLLTNPSFVPLEEVEVREEEIIRLREGWEKMEGRWREAVQMLDGWRSRMASSGQTVNLEELKMGLSLSPLKDSAAEEFSHNVEAEYEEGDTQADINAMDDSQVPNDADPTPDLDLPDSDDCSELEEDEIDSPQSSPVRDVQDLTTTDVPSSSPGPPPQLSPLKDINSRSSRQGQFTTIIEENTWDLAQLTQTRDDTENQQSHREQDKNQNQTQVSPPAKPLERPTSLTAPTKAKVAPSSNLPRPTMNPLPQQSPVTIASIAAKLAASGHEADAARVRAKLKAIKAASVTMLEPAVGVDVSAREPVKENGDNRVESDTVSKKRKASDRILGGRASRRRSTLSPWELESLLLGSAALSPSKQGPV